MVAIIQYPYLRISYITQNYLGKILIYQIKELELLKQFISKSKNLTSTFSSLTTIHSLEENIETLITTHLQMYQSIYTLSLGNNYENLESYIINNFLPILIDDTKFIYQLLYNYINEWKTQFSNTSSISLYSVLDWTNILNLSNALYDFVNQSIALSYSGVYQLIQLSDKFHYTKMFFYGKIYIYENIDNNLFILIQNINSFILQLETNQLINSTTITSFQNQWLLLNNNITNIINVQRNLWNFTYSMPTLLSSSIQYTLLLASDTKIVPSIYADGQPPLIENDSNSWKYINTTSGKKINWYFASYYNSIQNLSFSNLKSVFFIIKFNSLVSLPFLTIYTTNSNGNYWYGKRKNYTQYTPVLNQWYLLYLGDDPSIDSNISSFLPSFNSKLVLNYSPDSINFKTYVGETDINNTDNILFLTLSSDSSANVNNVNFTISMMGYKTNTMTYLNRNISYYKSLTGFNHIL